MSHKKFKHLPSKRRLMADVSSFELSKLCHNQPHLGQVQHIHLAVRL